MDEDKTYWLNDFGDRYWYKKSDMSKSAHRSYHWVDRVTFINEGSVHYLEDDKKWSTSDRRYLSQKSYTDFKLEIDDWVPILDFYEYAAQLKLFYDAKKYNL